MTEAGGGSSILMLTLSCAVGQHMDGMLIQGYNIIEIAWAIFVYKKAMTELVQR